MNNRKWNLNRLLALALACGLGSAPIFAFGDDAATNTPATPAAPSVTASNEAAAPAESPEDEPAMPSPKAKIVRAFGHPPAGQGHNPIVIISRNAMVKSNETVESVVVIGGSADVRGKVQEAVVCVGGDVTTTGADIGDAVVAVLGNIKVGPGSKIHGDVVSVGGQIEKADDAVIEGQQQAVDFAGLGLPHMEWLKKWVVHCVLKLRPLAPQVGWVWGVAGMFFLLYLLIALALPRAVLSCVEEMARRPATTFFVGLLTLMLAPLVFLVLAVTGIGLLVVPFVVAALVFAKLIGKVAFLEYFGGSVGRLFGAQVLSQPILSLLAGSALLALLYLVPVLGLLVLAVSTVWGLGVAVTVGFGSLRRETPARPASAPPPSPQAPMANFTAATPAAPVPAPMSVPSPAEGNVPGVPASGIAPTAPPAQPSEALTYPRASFWERMGAGFLDLILMSILGGLVGGPPQMFLVWLGYFAGMWAWRGTTLGGVVLNLKVVRLDDKPVTFPVALVRGLAAGFSTVVFFLGFFWIAWDKERQGWHDRVAGTVVIRVPRSTPLICL